MKGIGPNARSAWIAVSMMVLTLAASGCRGRRTGTAIPAGRVDTPEASAKKLAGAGVAIVAACAIQPFANASKGVIVAETGLHEDVFDLRDPKTYHAIPFGLNEALRLQDLLRKETSAAGNTHYSAQQAACVEQFASHFQALTDPLVQADAEQKQLDVSAFDKASKEAEQETEQQTEQEQKAMAPQNSGGR